MSPETFERIEEALKVAAGAVVIAFALLVIILLFGAFDPEVLQ